MTYKIYGNGTRANVRREIRKKLKVAYDALSDILDVDGLDNDAVLADKVYLLVENTHAKLSKAMDALKDRDNV